MTRSVPLPVQGGFSGFGAGWRGFFADLDANQSRDWFEAERGRYETAARAPMAALVASLSLALAVREVPLMGDPKRALFRLHRDVRFARDKRPYKTQIAAVLTRDGDKNSPGLLYIHLGLDAQFVALGFYGLEPPRLTRLREAILADKTRWLATTAKLAKAGLTLSSEAAAARLPRGITAVQAEGLEDVLRLKAFIVRQPLADAALLAPGLVDILADFATRGRPLLDFGWAALR